MFTVTLSKGKGKGKMKKGSHPLACQHSGRWHLFLRFCKPHRQTWNKSRTQNQYSHFGLKAVAEFARSAWKPGWQGRASTNSCAGARSCSFLQGGLVHWQSQRVQETIRKATWLLSPGTQLHCGHYPFYAQVSPGQGQLTWKDVGTPPTQGRWAW